MGTKLPKLRLFILGAGFSKPAGFPIANELLINVREKVRDKFRQFNWDGPFEQDIQEWGKLYPGKDLSLESVIAFSHRKHYLQLMGSEEYFKHGSRTVVAVRQAIQEILSSSSTKSPLPLYLEFAKHLTENDTVFTFNYDTLLEDTLDFIGKPYSLTPEWWLEEDNEKDYSRKYINIIKLHGSIDWYDKDYHEYLKEYMSHYNFKIPDKDPIFGEINPIKYETLARGKLIKGFGENLCSRVFRIPNHKYFLETLTNSYEVVPFLLPPAFDKLLGHDPVRDLWQNMHRSLESFSNIIIIGYSMPPYDSYAYEAIGQLLYYYQHGGEKTFWNQKRIPIQIITLSKYKKLAMNNYPFLNQRKTRVWKNGLNSRSLNWIDWGPEKK